MTDSELRDALAALLAQAPGEVVAVYLYGSRARGTARRGSDVDLGVLLTQRPQPTLASVARDLEALVERVIRLPVEAVALNGASPDLIHRVLRDGILVLDRDRVARLRFEVQARNEFFDMAPVRRLYRRLSA